MRWFLACALLVVAGCGEPVPGQGETVVTLTFPPETWPEHDLTCANDPPPSGDELLIGNGCELNDLSGDCMMFFGAPAPGPCTLLIRLRDDTTGERLCVHERDFVVSPVGDTEVHFTVDDCESVTMPL